MFLLRTGKTFPERTNEDWLHLRHLREVAPPPYQRKATTKKKTTKKKKSFMDEALSLMPEALLKAMLNGDEHGDDYTKKD